MTNLGSLSADVLLAPGPNDSVSELRWSPMSNHLTISAWDNILRVYEITQSSGSPHSGNLLFTHALSAPLLSCDWSKDGTHVVTGSTDHKAFLLDLNAHGSLPIQVAAHAAPIKSVRFVTVPGSNEPILATGSWDETIKFWDVRQNTPLASLNCEGRVFSMDSAGMLLAAATSEGKVHVVDLNNPTVCRTTTKTALHKQIRVVSCFPTGDGYAVGGIEGRCAFVYLNPERASENFSFRCHRFDTPASASTSASTSQRSLLSSHLQMSSTDVYAVNAISFHPLHRTFSTAGSDGSFAFWDQAAHLRLKHFPHVAATSASSSMAGAATDRQTTSFGSGGSGQKPGNVSTGVAGQAAITATGFNGDGGLFAYAVGYDWSRGYRGSLVGREDRVLVHVVGDECLPKRNSKAGRNMK